MLANYAQDFHMVCYILYSKARKIKGNTPSGEEREEEEEKGEND